MNNTPVEYGSYATHLERRCIMPCWNSSFRRAGRFVFKSMSRKDTDGTHWDLTIGHEMTSDTSYHRNDRDRPDDKWIFRTFLDGTAFYHQSRLHSTLYHYGARHKIEKVIEKHYFLDTTIDDPSGNRYAGQIKVYKRKPLSQYSKAIALVQEQSLGDYLVRKYNGRTHDTTTV